MGSRTFDEEAVEDLEISRRPQGITRRHTSDVCRFTSESWLALCALSLRWHIAYRGGPLCCNERNFAARTV
jgi:hypothetical protein